MALHPLRPGRKEMEMGGETKRREVGVVAENVFITARCRALEPPRAYASNK